MNNLVEKIAVDLVRSVLSKFCGTDPKSTSGDASEQAAVRRLVKIASAEFVDTLLLSSLSLSEAHYSEFDEKKIALCQDSSGSSVFKHVSDEGSIHRSNDSAVNNVPQDHTVMISSENKSEDDQYENEVCAAILFVEQGSPTLRTFIADSYVRSTLEQALKRAVNIVRYSAAIVKRASSHDSETGFAVNNAFLVF